MTRTPARYRWASRRTWLWRSRRTPSRRRIKPTSCHWISARHPKSDEPEDEREPDGTDDEYEYVADSSGLEAPSDTDLQLADSMSAARRRRYESKTSAAVTARKYKFRKRMLTVLALLTVASAAAPFTVPRSTGGCADRSAR